MIGLYCPDSVPNILGIFDISIAPKLLFYSYIPVIIAALLIGLFVVVKDRFSFVSKLLFFVSFFYTLWTLNIFIAWIDAFHSHVMFSWFVTPFFEVLMFIFAVYFTLVFIDKNRNDISYKAKISLFLIASPIIILLPFKWNIPIFNTVNCEGTPGYLWYYLYAFETVSIGWIIFACIRKYKELFNQKKERRQVLYTMIGMTLFLTLFFGSNVIGQYAQIQEISFIGSFGLVLFLAFLAYLIVEYRAFKIKLLGAQALVATLNLLVGSQFFYATDTTSYILTAVTLLLSLIFGYILVRSVKRDDERKEQLQMMADKLASANDQLRKLDNAKTEFISIASHQLRTPITAIKGFASLLMEGSYGELTDSVKGAISKVYDSSERLVALIEDLLNVSRIESGRMQFAFEKADVSKLIKELYDNFILIAKNKNFFLEMKMPETPLPEIVMDYTKIRELVSNFVDNALKYTEQGGATISAEMRDNGVVIDENGFVIPDKKSEFGKVVRITVKDTGIGIPKEEIPYLFKKFSRGKDVSRLHVGGTGLGLYVGKAIAEAHHGQVWVESEGDGKGSSFIIEIPIEHV